MKGKRESLGSCEVDSAEANIKQAALILNNEIMLDRISGIDMKSKEVQYHHSCRRNYIHQAESTQRAGQAGGVSDRTKSHQEAFVSLKKHIDTTLVENEGSVFLTSLHKQYVKGLGEDTSYPAARLCEKILREYQEHLTTIKSSNKTGIIVYNKKLSPEVAVKRANFDGNSVLEAAYHLR